jgi:hypothetical protein
MLASGLTWRTKFVKNNRLTVADLRALKGKRQLTMLYVDTLDEAAAPCAAGIDILSIIAPRLDTGNACCRR